MTNIFLRIQEQLAANLPFAVYSKPGSEALTGVFQVTEGNFTVTDHTESGFIFAPFNQGSTAFIPHNQSDIITSELKPEDAPALSNGLEPNPDYGKKHFENLVNQCITTIKSGEFDKLVASRTEIVENESIDIIALYKRLLYTYPNALRYCFFSPETGLWMGATPEQLIKVEANTLHTVALAGTQLYSPEKKAVWQDKEKQEQLFVTQYITNTLQPFTTTISATEPYTFRAGNLVHIKTDISAEIASQSTLKEVISALHPTPAVCGLPKAEAMGFLIDNEDYNREYYAGYLGELNHDFATGQPKTDLFVNLRCMKVTDNKAHLYIGCGITADSDPEKEYMETVNKSMTMKKLF
ncbi:isochorismate synthase [Flavobacterium akiainvivens]|uniref:isochorismate synthase n=1 Tax=Flavobacterium akiainvivens TaxID=1202724 RepID=A0A0M9VJM9_9FLAO|nr:isochorismate synthase [Flavobacterium akiainvivens]KOS07950.1 isochorismate synthase [Flavobacterium akiainvivens]SFQ29505.1 isochorismate synthase [Flavobacterium akiainvivens]